MPYKNILVAVDLGATTETIMRRAAALARQDDAKLHVLHVIEPLAITYGGDIPMDFSAMSVHCFGTDDIEALEPDSVQ